MSTSEWARTIREWPRATTSKVYRRVFRVDEVTLERIIDTGGIISGAFGGTLLIALAIGNLFDWGGLVGNLTWRDWGAFLFLGAFGVWVLTILFSGVWALLLGGLYRFGLGGPSLVAERLVTVLALLMAVWAVSVVQNMHDFPDMRRAYGAPKTEFSFDPGDKETLMRAFGGDEERVRDVVSWQLRVVFFSRVQEGMYAPLEWYRDIARTFGLYEDPPDDETARFLEGLDRLNEDGYRKVLEAISAGLGGFLVPLYFNGLVDREAAADLDALMRDTAPPLGRAGVSGVVLSIGGGTLDI